ncbi:hypothetical protein [Nocardia sp. bgisy118]|uniref:hypothetical protein n=1 Tax=Nocardia sp. bgisy118 TaxID=3413786 RepID=UPI003F4A4084
MIDRRRTQDAFPKFDRLSEIGGISGRPDDRLEERECLTLDLIGQDRKQLLGQIDCAPYETVGERPNRVDEIVLKPTVGMLEPLPVQSTEQPPLLSCAALAPKDLGVSKPVDDGAYIEISDRALWAVIDTAPDGFGKRIPLGHLNPLAFDQG